MELRSLRMRWRGAIGTTLLTFLLASVALAVFSRSASAEAALAAQPGPRTVNEPPLHLVSTMTVDAPASVGEPFKVQTLQSFDGTGSGVPITIVLQLVVVDPDGHQTDVGSPIVTEYGNTNAGGVRMPGSGTYVPRQNGEFVFRLFQLALTGGTCGGAACFDPARETLLVERRITTDKGDVPSASLVPAPSGVIVNDPLTGPSAGWIEGRQPSDPSTVVRTFFGQDGYHVSIHQDLAAGGLPFTGGSGMVGNEPMNAGIQKAGAAGNQSIELDARQVDGGPSNSYGVACHVTPNGGYGGYLLWVGSDGAAGILKNDSSQNVDLASATVPAANNYHLRADCAGDHQSLFVNGIKVAESRDSDYPSGRVGLYVATNEANGIDVAFTNLSMSVPPSDPATAGAGAHPPSPSTGQITLNGEIGSVANPVGQEPASGEVPAIAADSREPKPADAPPRVAVPAAPGCPVWSTSEVYGQSDTFGALHNRLSEMVDVGQRTCGPDFDACESPCDNNNQLDIFTRRLTIRPTTNGWVFYQGTLNHLGFTDGVRQWLWPGPQSDPEVWDSPPSWCATADVLAKLQVANC